MHLRKKKGTFCCGGFFYPLVSNVECNVSCWWICRLHYAYIIFYWKGFPFATAVKFRIFFGCGIALIRSIRNSHMKDLHKNSKDSKTNVCVHAQCHCQKGAATDHFKVFNSQPHWTWALNLLLVYMNKVDTFFRNTSDVLDMFFWLVCCRSRGC